MLSGTPSRYARYGMLCLLAAPVLGQRYVPPPPPLILDPCATIASPAIPVDPAAKKPLCPPPASAAPAGVRLSATPSRGEPSASEKFPYPGSAAPPAPTSSATPAETAPASEKFPYPGETSSSPDAVPEGNTPRYVPDGPDAATPTDSSSSSSSSSAQDAGSDAGAKSGAESSADPDLAGKRAAGGRRKLAKVSAVTPDDRVATDLEVAKFYSDQGNYQAAYMRSKDATKILPEDPEGHFALAQAAEKLHMKDEAASEYARYLELDPAGKQRSAAQRALAGLR